MHACPRHWTKEVHGRHEAMRFNGWGTCADQLKALAEGA